MGARLTLASPPRDGQSRQAVVVILWSGVWMPPLPRAGAAYGWAARVFREGGVRRRRLGLRVEAAEEKRKKGRKRAGSPQRRRRDRPGFSPRGGGRRCRPLPAVSSAWPAAGLPASGSGWSYWGGSSGPRGGGKLEWARRRPPWRSSNSATRYVKAAGRDRRGKEEEGGPPGSRAAKWL